mmetsp:Transcript_37306/g.107791  ORF Transcript_37306/g.107791 Transcript_37306/m.107791 type:complete len:409 (-) Transcript_37306:333-1559(-)
MGWRVYGPLLVAVGRPTGDGLLFLCGHSGGAGQRRAGLWHGRHGAHRRHLWLVADRGGVALPLAPYRPRATSRDARLRQRLGHCHCSRAVASVSRAWRRGVARGARLARYDPHHPRFHEHGHRSSAAARGWEAIARPPRGHHRGGGLQLRHHPVVPAANLGAGRGSGNIPRRLALVAELELPAERRRLVLWAHVGLCAHDRCAHGPRRPRGELANGEAVGSDHGLCRLHAERVLRPGIRQHRRGPLRDTGRLRAHRPVADQRQRRREDAVVRFHHVDGLGVERVFLRAHCRQDPDRGAGRPHVLGRDQHFRMGLLGPLAPRRLDRLGRHLGRDRRYDRGRLGDGRRDRPFHQRLGLRVVGGEGGQARGRPGEREHAGLQAPGPPLLRLRHEFPEPHPPRAHPRAGGGP